MAIDNRFEPFLEDRGPGTNRTAQPDGTTIEILPDGTRVTTHPDGIIVTRRPDGSFTTEYPDGTVAENSVDGTLTVTSPDGNVTTTNLGDLDIGSGDAVINEDGSKTITFNEGTVVDIGTDGTVTTRRDAPESPTGSAVRAASAITTQRARQRKLQADQPSVVRADPLLTVAGDLTGQTGFGPDPIGGTVVPPGAEVPPGGGLPPAHTIPFGPGGPNITDPIGVRKDITTGPGDTKIVQDEEGDFLIVTPSGVERPITASEAAGFEADAEGFFSGQRKPKPVTDILKGRPANNVKVTTGEDGTSTVSFGGGKELPITASEAAGFRADAEGFFSGSQQVGRKPPASLEEEAANALIEGNVDTTLRTETGIQEPPPIALPPGRAGPTDLPRSIGPLGPGAPLKPLGPNTSGGALITTPRPASPPLPIEPLVPDVPEATRPVKPGGGGGGGKDRPLRRLNVSLSPDKATSALIPDRTTSLSPSADVQQNAAASGNETNLTAKGALFPRKRKGGVRLGTLAPRSFR